MKLTPKCDYTCELEEDGSDSFGDIEVNTTKVQEDTEEMVNLVECLWWFVEISFQNPFFGDWNTFYKS